MSCSAILVHYVHHHMQDMVVILEEGSHPLPRCPKFDMFVICRALNGRHHANEMCARGEERVQK